MLRRWVVAVLVFLTVLAAPAGAASSNDPAAKRREVQRQRAKVAADLNVLKATDAQVSHALDAMDANVRAQEAAAASAKQAADSAAVAAASARVTEAAQAASLERLRGNLRSIAVDAYVSGPVTRGLAVLDAASVADVTRRQALLDSVSSSGTDLVDQMRAAQEDLQDARRAAEDAAKVAQARRAPVEARLRDAKDAQDAQQRLSDQVEARLEQRLAEADSLRALDQQLAAQIASQQAALARRLGARNGRVSGVVTRVGEVAVTTVRGITVAASIAGRVDSLLSAAAADGIVLGGSGYRSPDQQAATRRANCGTTDYAVYQMPASQCSPPTARPGQSMHEQGLAIDFTYNGQIVSRSSPGFTWLRANASRYGLYNLPTEPWHWSTNGN
ncbi:MAG TPA: M15 family metallopeptidase [Acidimicrobiales bacterium]|nr:M15 family metallopeptidase [Acidimicrobiales bacterium]